MRNRRAVRYWLLAIVGWILLTMAIGAATRLTGSGLSMVEWRPVTGVLPPVGIAQWEQEFLKYQNFPEFKANPGMSLQEFKSIFWWEYAHRLVARSLLLVILLPLGLFAIQGRLIKKDFQRVLILLGLGAVQGVLGWFMVKSGLVQVPRVSHFRLMVHFIWACLILAYLAHWLAEEKAASFPESSREPSLFLRGLSWLCLAQLAFGALVAGSRAGYIFNTFPKMGDSWWPQNFFISSSLAENLFYNQINLQFFHRLGGWLLGLAAIWGWRIGHRELPTLILFQFVLGVLTLVWAVPLPLAVLHQVMGALLFFRIRCRR